MLYRVIVAVSYEVQANEYMLIPALTPGEAEQTIRKIFEGRMDEINALDYGRVNEVNIAIKSIAEVPECERMKAIGELMLPGFEVGK